MRCWGLCTAALLISTLTTVPLHGQQNDPKTPMSLSELARLSQNPVTDKLASVPFQNKTNFNFGPDDDTQNILLIEPLFHVPLSESWYLIPRVLFPVMWQPVPGQSTTFGAGDIAVNAFFCPRKTGKLSWGVGPSFLLDTATDSTLGTGMWSAGPAAVVLTTPGHFVVGSILTQLWSFTTPSAKQASFQFTELLPPSSGPPPNVNSFVWRFFANYNFEDGWYRTQRGDFGVGGVKSSFHRRDGDTVEATDPRVLQLYSDPG